MSMSGGGSGGTGEQKYNWNDTLKPYWENTLKAGEGLAQEPYQQYSGDTIAPFTTDQNWAMQAYRNLATNPGPVANSAESLINTTLGGAGTSDVQFNPDGSVKAGTGMNPRNINPWTESAVTAAGGATDGNPFTQAATTTSRNSYGGNNPYFEGQVQRGMDDIVSAYNQGASSDIRRMFNNAGAFGGSAHMAALGNAQGALGKNLSTYASGMYNDQYNRTTGLEESYLGRDQQNQQFDKNVGSQNFENWANRDLQAQTFNKQQGAQYYDAERQRQLGMIPMAMQYQQSQYDRYKPLMAVGDAQQQLMQQALNSQKQDWTQQQMFPQTQLDWLTGIMSRAQGGVAPNVSTTGGGTTINPISGLLGAGALYGAFNK